MLDTHPILVHERYSGLPEVPGVRWIFYRGEPASPEAEGLILWPPQPAELQNWFAGLPRLQFVQTVTAGVDRLLPLDWPPGVRLYNAAGLHDQVVAEHALAMMLQVTRSLYPARQAQQRRSWSHAYPLRSLAGQRALIWGLGRIGRRLSEMLGAMGMRVEGVRTRGGEEAGIKVWGQGEIEAALPGCDWLILLLPRTNQTVRILDAGKLARLGPQTWVLNLGRGDAIDLEALERSLASGRLGGAALDVTDPEPLPLTSALWGMDQVILTPHLAALSDDLPRRTLAFLAENARRFVQGQAMVGEVDRSRGY